MAPCNGHIRHLESLLEHALRAFERQRIFPNIDVPASAEEAEATRVEVLSLTADVVGLVLYATAKHPVARRRYAACRADGESHTAATGAAQAAAAASSEQLRDSSLLQRRQGPAAASRLAELAPQLASDNLAGSFRGGGWSSFRVWIGSWRRRKWSWQ